MHAFHNNYDTLKRVDTVMVRSCEPVKIVFEMGNHWKHVTGPVWWPTLSTQGAVRAPSGPRTPMICAHHVLEGSPPSPGSPPHTRRKSPSGSITNTWEDSTLRSSKPDSGVDCGGTRRSLCSTGCPRWCAFHLMI